MEFYPYPPEKRVNPFEPSDEDNYFVGCKLLSYLGNYEEIGNFAAGNRRKHAAAGVIAKIPRQV